MKKITQLILTFMLISLSYSGVMVVEKIEISKEFEPYVQSFIDLSGGLISEKDMKYVTMRFGHLEDNVAGTCTPIPYNQIIEVDIGWWKKNQNQFSREQLIFHELGHCVLFRDHVSPTSTKGLWGWLERLAFKMGVMKKENILKDGCPSSYMHPYTLSSTCINRHYQYYIDELFGLTTIEEYETTTATTTTKEYGL